jgi:hypothetical protein
LTVPAWPRRALWLVALVALAGCGRQAGYERFVPAEQAARDALEKALASWQRGEPHGAVAAAPAVQFVDTHHKPNQRLKAFAVLSLAPGEGPRVFTVRLTLDGPAEEVRARYVVLGIDPMWVMRQEDYDMTAHWEHPMKKS